MKQRIHDRARRMRLRFAGERAAEISRMHRPEVRQELLQKHWDRVREDLRIVKSNRDIDYVKRKGR